MHGGVGILLPVWWFGVRASGHKRRAPSHAALAQLVEPRFVSGTIGVRVLGAAPTPDICHTNASPYIDTLPAARPPIPPPARARERKAPLPACAREGRVLEAVDGTWPVTRCTQRRGQPHCASDYQSATRATVGPRLPGSTTVRRTWYSGPRDLRAYPSYRVLPIFCVVEVAHQGASHIAQRL